MYSNISTRDRVPLDSGYVEHTEGAGTNNVLQWVSSPSYVSGDYYLYNLDIERIGSTGGNVRAYVNATNAQTVFLSADGGRATYNIQIQANATGTNANAVFMAGNQGFRVRGIRLHRLSGDGGSVTTTLKDSWPLQDGVLNDDARADWTYVPPAGSPGPPPAIQFMHQIEASFSDVTYAWDEQGSRDNITNAHRRAPYYGFGAGLGDVVRSSEQPGPDGWALKHIPKQDSGTKGRAMIILPSNASQGIVRLFPYYTWCWFTFYIWFSSAHASGFGGTSWEEYFQRHKNTPAAPPTPNPVNPALALYRQSSTGVGGSDFSLKLTRRNVAGVSTDHSVPAWIGWGRYAVGSLMDEGSSGGFEVWAAKGITGGTWAQHAAASGVSIGYNYDDGVQAAQTDLGPYQGVLQSSRVVYTAKMRSLISDTVSGSALDPALFD